MTFPQSTHLLRLRAPDPLIP